jgi:hypothetical protein
VRGNRGGQGSESGGPDRRGVGGDAAPLDADADALGFETVILPARLTAGVARRVAIASNRDGISIADLLGQAAAAYDWQVDDDALIGRGGR